MNNSVFSFPESGKDLTFYKFKPRVNSAVFNLAVLLEEHIRILENVTFAKNQ
jgi:hypothetical protein